MKLSIRSWVPRGMLRTVAGGLALTALLSGVIAGRAANDDDFLREAVQSDQGFKELGGMLQTVTREMELSNVFDGEELARGRRLSGEVKDLHQKEMQAILRSLEKSLAEMNGRTNHLRTAGEGHRRVAESLSRLALLIAPAAENVAQQAVLDKMRALAANVSPLARQVEEGQPLKPEQKAAAENYGDQARAIAKETAAPDAARRMEKAAGELAAKDPAGAKRDLDAAIREMQEKLDGKSDSLAHAKETEQELKALAEELRKARDAASEIAKMPDANKAADKAMDVLVKESDIKDRLEAANQKDPAKDVAQAMDNMQKNQYNEAAQKLAEAQKSVEEQAKALDNQIQRASQEQLNAFKDVQQLAEQAQNLDALQDKVADIKAEQAAALGEQPQQAGEKGEQQPQQAGEKGKMSPENQQKLEGDMAEAAKEMNEAGQKEAGQEMGQSEQQTDKGEHGPARQSLEKAAQSLAKAKQQAEQALAQAEEKLEAGQSVADTAELGKMQQELGQMQQQMQQSPEQAKNQAQQMGQLAQEMKQAALPQAAQAMQQAQQSAQQNNPQQAQQQMQQAQQQLAQVQKQAQQAQQAMNTPPKGPPQQAQNSPPGTEQGPPGQAPSGQKPGSKDSPPKDPVSAGQEKNEAAGNDPLKVRYVESTWRAKLPDSERQALLSARKEPYPPQMEPDVKKYYELLAE